MSEQSREDRRARRRGLAARRAQYSSARLGDFDAGALAAAIGRLLAGLPLPVSRHVRRWVPIGPSVARSSGTASYVRTTGRVRDIAVSPDGTRVYAGTGKGGLWYSDDAGQLWRPVGDAAARSAVTGGPNSAKSCGSLLVAFGATAADDFVMVGTGESGFTRPARPALAGLGVLAARGPAASTAADPWEPGTGLPVMEGVSAWRMARHPAATPGTTSGTAQDRVLAATTGGLFLGTRSTSGGSAGFTWALVPFSAPSYANTRPMVTDVLWLSTSDPSGNGRIVVAVATGVETPTTEAPLGSGVAYSDDLGVSFRWVGGLAPSATPPGIAGRMSLAHAADGRVYVLGDIVRSATAPNENTVWRIPDMRAASPAAAVLSGTPEVWRTHDHRSQRDYDQAIAVDVVTATGNPDVDRIYLGGAYAQIPVTTSPDTLVSSLWCVDVSGTSLVHAPGVSPPAGGGRPAGLIGDNVHADVHCIRLATVNGVRQVWVGCDGGVFVSPQAGRANSFGPRVTGLAAFEVNFVTGHPTSSHFGMAGVQDNGRLMRVGEVVWEDTFGGDGGGVLFHPVQSQYVLAQYVNGSWECRPLTGFVDPLARTERTQIASNDREDRASAFYSGPSAIRRQGTSTGRIALGTNRVWLTDNLSALPNNTWRVLPFQPASPAPVADPRPGGADTMTAFGVPGGGTLGPVTGGIGPFGPVLTVKWVSATELLALFDKGVVRWTQHSSGQWSTDVLLTPAPLPPPPPGPPQPRLDLSVTTLTDLAPIPETSDFYLTCTGDTATTPGDTCYRFDNATRAFVPTQLRRQLPAPAGAAIGPLDPAQAVVVDPTDANHVYVGTITGVWHGQRSGATVNWFPMVNDLPQAVVQDLSIWTGSAPDSPRLLRAGLQSRGVWEVDLAAPQEPPRTYLRVHSFDNRRRFPVPMANPRVSPVLAPLTVVESPDIVVRPQVPATAPRWQFGTGAITATSNWGARHAIPVYELWTFQTAFRWHFPSVTADGIWTDALADLIELHRVRNSLGTGKRINRALWNLVVGGTRLTTAGALSSASGDPLAVYRAPWHSPGAMSAAATELDLMDHVHPTRSIDRIWRVFREPSVVDVLVHHRDARPLPAGDAKVVLLMRTAPTAAALLAADASGVPGYIAAVIGGGTPAAPAGWRTVPASGTVTHPLTVELSARMPRAVSIDVNLSTEPLNDFAVFLAVTFSSADQAAAAPSPALPAAGSVADLVQRWPYAAMRIVRLVDRPPGTP
ncbi:hypothetical protein CS0771_47700 [Catellatospora sp. IY07-71]|uniref:hypothetical protein n=1 Tax=Catellatospora sp. IY07-71 TaxID=2728827 RepID=UPI001BB44E95|nr:hypothetical protein [Catellatospora sp. IY07-71]BCJ75226.1 hypothetical protein CS0771_47700 [Catellatospora sp. IY07-71]